MANERFTANPNNLNGSSKSQMIGYNSIKMTASGQHKMSRINQSKKEAMFSNFYFYIINQYTGTINQPLMHFKAYSLP